MKKTIVRIMMFIGFFQSVDAATGLKDMHDAIRADPKRCGGFGIGPAECKQDQDNALQGDRVLNLIDKRAKI